MNRLGFSLLFYAVSALIISSLLILLASAPAVSGPQLPTVLTKKINKGGPQWSELSVIQKTSLKPLEKEWSTIEPNQKQKWLEVAARMPAMPLIERERIQTRMIEWGRLSPQERGQVRMAYQEAKKITTKNRQNQWQAYQALSAEQKHQLQTQAKPAKASAPKVNTPKHTNKVQVKNNINPEFTVTSKPIAPTVMQTLPGATTNLISQKPTPPVHQQTGFPKIEVTPGTVHKTTLLPQRGPQAATTYSSTPSVQQNTLRPNSSFQTVITPVPNMASSPSSNPVPTQQP